MFHHGGGFLTSKKFLCVTEAESPTLQLVNPCRDNDITPTLYEQTHASAHTPYQTPPGNSGRPRWVMSRQWNLRCCLLRNVQCVCVCVHACVWQRRKSWGGGTTKCLSAKKRPSDRERAVRKKSNLKWRRQEEGRRWLGWLMILLEGRRQFWHGWVEYTSLWQALTNQLCTLKTKTKKSFPLIAVGWSGEGRTRMQNLTRTWSQWN